jgi:hypothetical protein
VPFVGYTPVITDPPFVFLMRTWINFVYFWDTTIGTWAQPIHLLGRWTHNLLLFDKRLTSHWTVNHQPLLSDKIVYMWPMTSVFEVFALLDCHTTFVYRCFGCPKTSVNKYQLTLGDELGERRLHT